MSEEQIIVKISFEDYEKRAIEWARDYANDISFTEKNIFESRPRRYCIIDMYKTFVRNKKLEKIELISQDDKNYWYNKSKEVFPQEMEKDLRRQLCIFLYFMNHIFDKYF